MSLIGPQVLSLKLPSHTQAGINLKASDKRASQIVRVGSFGLKSREHSNNLFFFLEMDATFSPHIIVFQNLVISQIIFEIRLGKVGLVKIGCRKTRLAGIGVRNSLPRH